MRATRSKRLRAPLVLGVGLCVGANVMAETGQRRAFELQDFYRVAHPTHVDVSPDGAFVVYQVRTTDLPRAETNTDLYRVPTTGGESKRLTWTDDEAETSPVHSPDGRWIAFAAKRGEQKSEQLWLMPAFGGEARPLTDLSTGLSTPVWSPDGKLIAFVSHVYPECGADDDCNAQRNRRRDEGPLDAHVVDDLLYRHWTSWADGKAPHVLVVEVATGEVRDLTPGSHDAPVFSLGGPPDFEFSPDSQELCYTRNPGPTEELAWSTNSDLWVVPVEPTADGGTRPARNLTAGNRGWDGSPSYSPDGRLLAFRRQLRASYESDLFRLAVLDRGSGSVRDLTTGFEDWVGAFHWLPDGTGLVFEAGVEGKTGLYRVSVDGGDVVELGRYATLDEFVLAGDGRTAFAVQRSVGSPREVWRLDLTGETEPIRLTRHNLELEQEVDIRPAETMWVDGTHGRRIQVFLVKPHGFDPGKKYPLILNVHGGPQGMWADAFRGDWQVYPGAGYVVAFSNPHGSTGYGQAFTEQISGDWGGAVFEDLMKVTDALEALPYVDAERMGAMGWSYGGYMMNWFQGHTDRFKALANMMGIFDLRSFYYATEELWFPEWDLGGPAWASELYERWNPASFVDRFDIPMLIVTGELDFRVPYTQGLMAFTALRRRGIPSRLVVLPEAGHWPGWYEMALYYTAHLDWFHRYLGGEPAPWSVEDFARNAVFDPKTGERIDGDSGDDDDARAP